MDVIREPRAEDLRPVRTWMATAVVGLAAAGALHLDGVTGQPASALTAGHGPGSAPATGDGASAAEGLLGPVTVAVQMVLLLAVVALLPARSRRTTVNGITTLGALAWASWLAGSLG